MYNVEFQLEGKTTIIQCRDFELMETICKRFSNKALIDLNKHYFVYSGGGGKEFNKKSKLSQMINFEDKKRKRMNILVNEIPDFSKDNLNIDNEIKKKNFETINSKKDNNSKDYHKLLSDYRNLSSRNLLLKTNLDTLETKNERLSTENKELDRENDELSERNDELEEENEKLKKKNKELTSEISKLKLDSQKRRSFSIIDTESDENKRKLELIGLTYELGIDEKSKICTKYSLGYKCLIMHLIQSNYISTEKVVRAMLEVDRNDFAPQNPYADRPIYIGYNVTISAPHMHALALEYLSDYCTKGAKILDIGSGSGFLTVALSKMTKDTGTVVGIDHIFELYDFGRKNIKKHHSELIKNGKVILVLGDGRKGYKKYGPYKAIHVGACSEEVPIDLLNQLDNNGRMFIPVGKKGETQNIIIVDKNSYGKVTYKPILSVCYSMLTEVDYKLNK